MNVLKDIISLLASFRSLLLVGAKFLALISCSYFIKKAEEYEVQWNLLTWFFPQVSMAINDLLSGLGTYILIIPCSIILLSFFITDNKTINWISGFFAMFGTLVGLIRGVFTRTIGEVYNLKIIVVTHIATLEYKRELFLLEFNRLSTEISQGIDEKLKYIQEHLQKVDLVIYDQKLNLLTNLEDVKLYALEVVKQLSQVYDGLHKPNPFNLTNYVSYTTIFIVGGIIAVAALIFYNVDSIKSLLVKQAVLNKEAAVHSSTLNDNLTTLGHETQRIIARQLSNAKDLQPTSAVVLIMQQDLFELQQANIKIGALLKTVFTRLELLESTMHEISPH